MPYTFELTFTGLCIFSFLGDKRRPSEVDVLLVYALEHSGSHRHIPYLGFAAENLDPDPTPSEYGLVPGYDGSQTSLVSLAGKNGVRIVLPPRMQPPPLLPRWRPKDAELPESPDPDYPEQEQGLGWAMALQRMNPETDDPNAMDPYGGLNKGKITTRVVLDAGMLFCQGFPHIPNGEYVKWEFSVPDVTSSLTARLVVTSPNTAIAEASSPIGPYSMARSVVLRIENIPDAQAVRIVGTDLNVKLMPPARTTPMPGALVQASITNLPAVSDAPPPERYLTHFRHFYEPATFLPPSPSLRLPRLFNTTITSGTSFCPPTTHTKAE